MPKQDRQFKRGDLVRIRTLTLLDGMMEKRDMYFVGTVLACRYKTGAYLIYPANSPLADYPYWVDESNLELLPDR